jgi:hypothetical protein
METLKLAGVALGLAVCGFFYTAFLVYICVAMGTSAYYHVRRRFESNSVPDLRTFKGD